MGKSSRFDVAANRMEQPVTFRIVPEGGVAVFEVPWVNFVSLRSPTPAEITRVVGGELSELLNQITGLVERTPYSVGAETLRPQEANPSRRGQVTEPAEAFTPSVMIEADSLYFSLGLVRDD